MKCMVICRLLIRHYKHDAGIASGRICKNCFKSEAEHNKLVGMQGPLLRRVQCGLLGPPTCLKMLKCYPSGWAYFAANAGLLEREP